MLTSPDNLAALCTAVRAAEEMSDLATQTHRLHVGGLTPSITSADLEGRFSTFGKVLAVEGAGDLDANGAYQTPRRSEAKDLS